MKESEAKVGLKIEPGVKVKNKQDERIGLVVPDILNLCGKEEVAVEYDRSSGVVAVLVKQLEALERINPQVSFEKCNGCVFFNGQECLRCTLKRARIHMGVKGNLPDRIYPYCQKGK